MSEREKMIEIVLDTEITGIKLRNITGGISTANAIADALIAAEIGGVSELKKHRVVVEKSLIPEDDNAVLPNIPPTVKQLYSGEEVEQIVKEREEYKHRAEVAERAVREFTIQGGCRSCPCKGRCGIFNRSAENDYQECYEAVLRIAEKYLAEEKKDE